MLKDAVCEGIGPEDTEVRELRMTGAVTQSLNRLTSIKRGM